jgi:hypothetical protein
MPNIIVAEQWRAACHVVNVTQREADADPPAFEDIAKRPNSSDFVSQGWSDVAQGTSSSRICASID